MQQDATLALSVCPVFIEKTIVVRVFFASACPMLFIYATRIKHIAVDRTDADNGETVKLKIIWSF